MFQGETAITIDDKGRLAVPTAYRDVVARECANRLVVTYSPFDAGCLYLYPQHVWERVRDQVNALPKTKSTSRLMQFKLVGAAAHVELDGNGRISIPVSQRAAIGIDKRAVLLGMGNGMATLARATTIADLYGSHAYGTIASVAGGLTTTARAAGPFAAAVYAATVGYTALLWTLAALALAAAVLAHRAEHHRP